MKKQFLECGKIVAAHGIKGEVRVQPWCDTPDFLTAFEALYFDSGKTPVTLERSRVHKTLVILKIAGIDTVEDAVKLRGKVVYINRDDTALSEGEYFVQDLIDCEVFDADTGKSYGRVYDCRATGANDVYYLRDDQGVERLVPAIDEVVLSRDIDAGVIKIRPLEGLFDDAN